MAGDRREVSTDAALPRYVRSPVRLLLVCGCLAMLAIQGCTSEHKTIIGCRVGDHEECDELCKRDNWLYGHCYHVDTDSLQCRCFAYKPSLNPHVCTRREHDHCHHQCLTDGRKAGGYCYPHANGDKDSGTPRCACFQRSSGTNRR